MTWIFGIYFCDTLAFPYIVPQVWEEINLQSPHLSLEYQTATQQRDYKNLLVSASVMFFDAQCFIQNFLRYFFWPHFLHLQVIEPERKTQFGTNVK